MYCGTRMTPCESWPQRFASTRLAATIRASAAGTPAASKSDRARSVRVAGGNVGRVLFPGWVVRRVQYNRINRGPTGIALVPRLRLGTRNAAPRSRVMAFEVRISRSKPETGSATLRTHRRREETVAEVWPQWGFNCLRWQIRQEDGQWADILYAPDWERTPSRRRGRDLFPFPGRSAAGSSRRMAAVPASAE